MDKKIDGLIMNNYKVIFEYVRGRACAYIVEQKFEGASGDRIEAAGPTSGEALAICLKDLAERMADLVGFCENELRTAKANQEWLKELAGGDCGE